MGTKISRQQEKKIPPKIDKCRSGYEENRHVFGIQKSMQGKECVPEEQSDPDN